MAKKTAEGVVEVRVLSDGNHGGIDAKANDVIEISAAEAEVNSQVDAHPDAVAYAKSLKKAAKKDEG